MLFFFVHCILSRYIFSNRSSNFHWNLNGLKSFIVYAKLQNTTLAEILESDISFFGCERSNQTSHFLLWTAPLELFPCEKGACWHSLGQDFRHSLPYQWERFVKNLRVNVSFIFSFILLKGPPKRSGERDSTRFRASTKRATMNNFEWWIKVITFIYLSIFFSFLTSELTHFISITKEGPGSHYFSKFPFTNGLLQNKILPRKFPFDVHLHQIQKENGRWQAFQNSSLFWLI